jgi:anti-anti-sigma factor
MVKISIREVEDKYVIMLGGYLDTSATPEVEKALAPLMESVDKDVILDCNDLDYIASSTLRLLLGVMKNVKKGGHHMYIRNLDSNIREAFELTGFLRLFELL